MTTPDHGAPYGHEPDADEQTMAMICHFGMVLFGWLPALIIYFVKGDNEWVKGEASKAFNFAITIQIAYIAVFILGIFFAVLDLGILGCFITLLYIGLWIAQAIFAVLNGMKINQNETTKYPFEIPILK